MTGMRVGRQRLKPVQILPGSFAAGRRQITAGRRCAARRSSAPQAGTMPAVCNRLPDVRFLFWTADPASGT
jgi:hypothetical protein